jgi:hypothetical protein
VSATSRQDGEHHGDRAAQHGHTCSWATRVVHETAVEVPAPERITERRRDGRVKSFDR